MVTEITKHINDTNASYRRLEAGNANNTDLFLDNEHYELFKDCGDTVTVRFSKTNLAQAILFISSILPKKYDRSAIHKKVTYSSEFVLDQLSILDSLFKDGDSPVETITQTWNVRKNVLKNNGQIDKRFYLNGLLKEVNYINCKGIHQKDIFTIRNYLAGGYSDLHIKKADDGIFDVIVTNTQTPYYDTKDQDIQELENSIPESIPPYSISYITGIKTKKAFSRNRIIFGAPGTGKSYSINLDRKELLGIDNEIDYERVTFHPDYSYANFVGTYKPVMYEQDINQNVDSETKHIIDILSDTNTDAQYKYDSLYDLFEEKRAIRVLPILVGICNKDTFIQRNKDGSEINNNYEGGQGRILSKFVSLLNNKREKGISYEYVPGPFMRMFVKALKNAQNVAMGVDEPRPFLLIIEEINRANVAAVFGDVFQLLDRKNNVSEYPIQVSEDIKKYLAKELGGNPEDYAKIKIPDNLFIWATMNSADQGVFPMDTAFKRRWDFTYLGIDDNDVELNGKYVSMIHQGELKFVEWNSLRKGINEFLANEKINEDKQLGPYFIAKDIVVPTSGNIIDKDRFNDVFKHKVLMYLFDDAAKQKRSKLFDGISAESSRYSKICEAFDKKGVDIFNNVVCSELRCLSHLPETNNSELEKETED